MIEAGTVVGFVTWVADKFSEMQSKDSEEAEKARNRLAAYLMEIAECLSRISDQLRRKTIPREQGHCLKVLAEGFAFTVASNLTSSMSIEVADNDWLYKLKKAAIDADNADGTILTGNVYPEGSESLIQNIERTAGQFRGLSIQTRAIGPIEKTDE